VTVAAPRGRASRRRRGTRRRTKGRKGGKKEKKKGKSSSLPLLLFLEGGTWPATGRKGREGGRGERVNFPLPYDQTKLAPTDPSPRYAG